MGDHLPLKPYSLGPVFSPSKMSMAKWEQDMPLPMNEWNIISKIKNKHMHTFPCPEHECSKNLFRTEVNNTFALSTEKQ